MSALRDRWAVLGASALLDHELASLALGVPVAQARTWLQARTQGGAAPGLERRYAATRALFARLDARPPPALVVGDVAAAVRILSPGLSELDTEELHVLALDSRNHVLGRVKIARGAVNRVMVSAREVFRPLIALGAARAIVAHNHPSGDPSPSPADRELTSRLGVAGELLGIQLVDHLVLGGGGYHSFAEAGARAAKRGRRRGNVGHAIGIG